MNTTHEPTTLYSRDPNTGKYKPVAEHNTFDYMSEGSYIVDIKPGCTSIKRRLYPERRLPEFEVLVERLSDALAKVIRDRQSEPIDVPRKLTKAQKQAWDMWKKAFKKDTVYLRGLQDSIDMALRDVVSAAAVKEKLANLKF